MKIIKYFKFIYIEIIIVITLNATKSVKKKIRKPNSISKSLINDVKDIILIKS